MKTAMGINSKNKKMGDFSDIMKKLEVIRAIVELRRLSNNSSDSELVSMISDLEDQIQRVHGISLKYTTPKELFGVSYRHLTKEQMNEYTQIKRLLNRERETIE